MSCTSGCVAAGSNVSKSKNCVKRPCGRDNCDGEIK